MKKIGWNHPADQADQWDGFNESGIEHFAGSPIRHLAREVNQNALDASNGATVKVSMHLKSVSTASIPDVNALRQTMNLCKIAAEKESPKAIQFFKVAIDELSSIKISVLEISDSNTLGMRGPSKNGTPYYAFMKAKGQSKKESSVATGSFGIGKFAPYAVSKLRTVFVSTVYSNELGELTQLTQGKSILMSHDDKKRRLQGTGFWGIQDKCQPIEGATVLAPEWLTRIHGDSVANDTTGTKLSILGFDSTNGWKENLAVSVAENFFGAIASGKLEVDIDETYILDSDSISEFFENESIRKVVEKQKNEPEQFDHCKHYLSVVQENPEVIIEESELLQLGLCEMRLLLDEGLPKKICFLRNGMFISDSIVLPGLKIFSDFKEFVAVVECKNKKGSELLRAMEPPRHDDFEPDRLPTKEDQKRGEKALRELSTWIRDMLKRHAKSPVSEVTTLDELKEYFAEEEGAGGGVKGSGEVNPIGAIVIRAKPLPYKKNPHLGFVESDIGGDTDGKIVVPNLPGTNGDGAEKENVAPISNLAMRPVGIANVRAIVIDGATRRISFTPGKDGAVAIELLEAGADSDYEIDVLESDIGSVVKGKIHILVKGKTRVTLVIKLAEQFLGALKVVAYEI